MTPEEVKQKTQGMMQIAKGAVLFLVSERDTDRNMNLQIVPAPADTVNASQLREFEREIDKSYPGQYPGFVKVSSSVVTVSGLPALEYVMDVKRIDKALRQRLVIVINKGTGYLLTFTSPLEMYAQANETCFDVVVKSFSVRTPPSPAFSREDLISAADAGDLARVQLILSSGVPANAASERNGLTPLIGAAQRGHVEVVRKLLEFHADVNAKANDGLTAVMQAAQAGHAPVVKALVAAGAELNIKRGDGATALIGAAQHGHAAIVDELLAGHANVHIPTDAGVTAIAAASLYGHGGIVRALIKAGADVNVKDRRFGATSLIMAAQQGHIEVVRALIEAHADVNARMPNGQSAMDLAQRQGRTQVISMLVQAGAK
jgi:ankyrin repeat protein